MKPMHTKSKMPRLTPDRDEFAQFYTMFKKWFEAEELEVTDFVIGRFASRLQDFIKFGGVEMSRFKKG